MLLHTVYTVMTPTNTMEGPALPFTISLDADTTASLVEQENDIQLHIDRKIDPTKLELVEVSGRYKVLSDGTEVPVPTLRLIEDEAVENILSQDFISALTFLSDKPLSLIVHLLVIGLYPKRTKIESCLNISGLTSHTFVLQFKQVCVLLALAG